MEKDNIFDYIRSHSNIIDIISERMPLKKKGSQWAGICPFHDDHKPSMFVSEQKQLYKCFSCGAGGDIFKFVMEYDKLEFKKATQVIASFYNIPLPKKFSFSQANRIDPYLDMKKMHVWAKDIYHRYLLTAKGGLVGRNYLKKRKLSMSSIKTFEIGLAPDFDFTQGFLLKIINAQNLFQSKELKKSSLFSFSYNRSREFFRNRIIFPIFDEKNEILGFAGRTIGKDEPKYLNVRESPWFKKREILYGLKESYQRISQTKEVYVVEGYLDVIACHAANIPAVAPMGTALTKENILKLKRYAEKIHLLFDGDESGRKATWRTACDLATHSIDGQVYTLPATEDPFDFIQKHSSKEVNDYLQHQGINLYSYLIGKNTDTLSPVEKKRVLDKLIPVYNSITDNMVKNNFGELIDKSFSINLEKWLEKNKTPYQKSNRSNFPQPKKVIPNNLIAKERSFVLFLCNHPYYTKPAASVIPIENFEDNLSQYIYKRLMTLKGEVSFQDVLNLFYSDNQEKVAEYITSNSLKKDSLIENNNKANDKATSRISDKVHIDEDIKKVNQKVQDEFNGRVIILKKEYIHKKKKKINKKIIQAREDDDWERECVLQEERIALYVEEDNLKKYF